jgi:hypothetical protein
MWLQSLIWHKMNASSIEKFQKHIEQLLPKSAAFKEGKSIRQECEESLGEILFINIDLRLF